MRKAALVAALLLVVSGLLAQDAPKVWPSVTEYLQSLITEPVDTIEVRVDSLIAQAAPQGEETQSKVAGLAFDFFNSSPFMGQEAVSVYIADNYFLNKKLKWSDDSTYPALYTFAEFNRQSLVGMPAPELRMEGIDSLWLSMRNVSAPYKLLYFYEPQCATCRKETPALVDFAKSYKGRHIAIFAVYTQADRESWVRYVEEHFAGIDNPDVTVFHLWDPEFESDFQRKYAVLTTPAMFLLDDQNLIKGRKLNVEALSGMLDLGKSEIAQYRILFDRIFDSLRPLDLQDASVVAGALARKCGSDSALFRSTMYNLYQYFRNSEEYELQQGAFTVAEKYIAGSPEYWSAEYLREVIHQLEMEKLNPVGAYAPDVVLKDRRGRSRCLLDCSLEKHLIFFHLVDCEECASEIAQLRAICGRLEDADVSVTLVYVGKDYEKWRAFIRKNPCNWRYLWDPDGSSGMRDLYDLEYAPHAYLLDGSDRIIGKNFKVKDFKNILGIL